MSAPESASAQSTFPGPCVPHDDSSVGNPAPMYPRRVPFKHRAKTIPPSTAGLLGAQEPTPIAETVRQYMRCFAGL